MIAIVILNWNGAEMLRRFLPSVVNHSAPEGEVIVADNGSTDESLDLVRREFPTVRLLPLKHNHGFAGGYNIALQRLEAEHPGRYDLYLLLNSDVRVTPRWLTPIREYFDHHPEVAAAQPKLRSEWDAGLLEYAGACGGYLDRDGYPFCRGRIFNVAERDMAQYDTVASIFWATGAALAVRATDWAAVGGFDERFFAHNEEIDFCWRLRARGRSIVCIPASVVYHVGGGTLPKDNPRKTYLNFRNNLTMLYKNLPDGELHRVMRHRFWLDHLAALQFLLKGDWANARAVWRGRNDFYAWRNEFRQDRAENLAQTRIDPIPERFDFSLIWAFFVQKKRTFTELSKR